MLVLGAAISLFAQDSLTTVTKTQLPPHVKITGLTVEVREEKLESKLMSRAMPYRVILPVGYETASESNHRYPVIYLLHGLTGHFNNWTDLTKLKDYASFPMAIYVTPEGGDGWYTDSVSKASDKWESYIIQELIPEVDKKFRTNTGRDQRAIAGLSMGGFGALKFGLKYPDKFVLAGSFSGALGAADITEKSFPGAIGKTIDGIFGPAGSDTRKANDLFAIIRSTTPEKTKTIPFIYLDCGTEDFLFQNNRDFVSLLIEKKVPHEYRQLPGAHEWKYWDKQVQEFLRVANRFFAN
ncbi:MAG TPA: alpha/beta hydrolase family protein [Pyrinomonadaceae bacterium]|nr:alpha/beta hydrolase family protein [Pyrinomonadaceae bacterium]